MQRKAFSQTLLLKRGEAWKRKSIKLRETYFCVDLHIFVDKMLCDSNKEQGEAFLTISPLLFTEPALGFVDFKSALKWFEITCTVLLV